MRENIAPLIDRWYRDWFRNEQLYNQWARKRGINYNELFAIHVLHSTGGCTPSYIAQFLSVPKQTVNSLLGRLEKRNLIRRLPSPEDRRSCLVTLSDEGHQWADKLLTELKEIEYRVFSSFTMAEIDKMIELNALLTDRFGEIMGEESDL